MFPFVRYASFIYQDSSIKAVYFYYAALTAQWSLCLCHGLSHSKRCLCSFIVLFTHLSRTGIFHALFTFILSHWHLLLQTQALFQTRPYTPCHPFRPLILFQTLKKIKSACIQTHDVANTTLKLQRTTRFRTRQNATGLSNCPAERQDQKPPPGSANRHDRSSANSPRRRLPRNPPERSTPTCRAKDR